MMAYFCLKRLGMKFTAFYRFVVGLGAGLMGSVAIHAVCPLCTVAVGAGAGLMKRLGIDDTITGLWIGALLASSIAWTINILNSYQIRFIGRKPLVAVIFVLLFVWPLYHYNFLWVPRNTLWGIDKVIFGLVLGAVVFAIASIWYCMIKAGNNGRAQFPFQKIVMPLGLLSVVSFVLYCITK
jgi:hypothetical protein